MNTKITITVLALIVVGGILFYTNRPMPTSTTEEQATTTSQVATTTSNFERNSDIPGPGGPTGDAVAPAGITLTEIAKHKDAKSCWVAIRTSVYDLTTWIAKHPGGPDKILSICGKDATTTFENQHGGMERPEAALTNFRIGALVK